MTMLVFRKHHVSFEILHIDSKLTWLAVLVIGHICRDSSDWFEVHVCLSSDCSLSPGLQIQGCGQQPSAQPDSHSCGANRRDAYDS